MIAVPEETEFTTAHRRDVVKMSARIKDCALGLGFHKVGIVRAESLQPERYRLEEWLARGYHGEMSWMTRDPEQRTDPRKIFPQAKSVVVVAQNYYTPHQHAVGTTRVGRQSVLPEPSERDLVC